MTWGESVRKHFPGYLGLLLVLLLGVFIRTRNWALLEGKYPLALDPHYFLRIAQYISEHGTLFATDTLRYFPLGFDTARENIFLSHVMVWMHQFLSLFTNLTLEETVLLYPVIFFALGLIVYYFLAKDLFNAKVAVIASLFMSILPTYLHRTLAGFSDKEALGLFFMYLTFFLYLRAVRNPKIGPAVLYGLGAGIATGFMGLAWGGFKFILVIIAAFNLVLFFMNKTSPRMLLVYVSWVVPFSFMLSVFIAKYGGFMGLLTSSTTGITYLVLVLFVLSWLLRGVAKKWNVPRAMLTLVALFLVVLLITPVFLLVAEQGILGEITSDVRNLLVSGLAGDRLALTVAENKQPFLQDWLVQFGAYFYLFFLGSILLFARFVKPLGNYQKHFTIFFTVLIGAVILSRLAPRSVLNGESLLSQIVYLGSLILFALFSLGFYVYCYYKKKEVYAAFLKLNPQLLFILLWFFVMIVAARGGIRLFIMLVPITALLAAYVLLRLYTVIIDAPDKFYRYTALIILGLFLFSFFPTWQITSIDGLFSRFTKISMSQATYTGPSYNKQWQESMEWVQEKTPQDAVFAHWWDYGYWVQTGGQRATITDGGNFIPYWNHLMGRHVLSARTEVEALQFLQTHNATHLLILSDEIGKYTAYSSIGSDDNFDIFSWIGTFVMNPQATQRSGNVTTYLFQGSTNLDEDFVYKDKVFPQQKSFILGFRIPVEENEDTGDFTILQPEAIISFNAQQETIPVTCVFQGEEKLTFETPGLDGCLRIFPRYLSNQYQQENGAVLWVSRRGTSSLWTKLYLFNEASPYFQLVYDDSSQNKLAYFQGRILGPLKIWRITYPEDLDIPRELREDYLAEQTPEWLRLSGITL